MARTRDTNDIALEQAILGGDVERVGLLLKEGVSANGVDRYGDPHLLKAARNNDQKIISQLLAAGADVNAVGANNNTALMYLALNSYAVTIQTLLDAGADVNAANGAGYTAVMLAINGGNTTMVLQLIAAGADINATNQNGETALDIARRLGFNEKVKILTLSSQRQAAMEMAYSLRNERSSFFYHAPGDILKYIISPMVNHISESDPEFNSTPSNKSP